MEAILGFGLVDGGTVVSKRERDFLDKEKENIEDVIEKMIVKYVKEILKEACLDLKQIEQIRNCSSTAQLKTELLSKRKT